MPTKNTGINKSKPEPQVHQIKSSQGSTIKEVHIGANPKISSSSYQFRFEDLPKNWVHTSTYQNMHVKIHTSS
jgi:hypothetical protein